MTRAQTNLKKYWDISLAWTQRSEKKAQNFTVWEALHELNTIIETSPDDSKLGQQAYALKQAIVSHDSIEDKRKAEGTNHV